MDNRLNKVQCTRFGLQSLIHESLHAVRDLEVAKEKRRNNKKKTTTLTIDHRCPKSVPATSTMTLHWASRPRRTVQTRHSSSFLDGQMCLTCLRRVLVSLGLCSDNGVAEEETCHQNRERPSATRREKTTSRAVGPSHQRHRRNAPLDAPPTL